MTGPDPAPDSATAPAGPQHPHARQAAGRAEEKRVAAAVRSDIIYGHIAPGAVIDTPDIARRCHASLWRARRALEALAAEDLIYHPGILDWYAAPAGPPRPAAAARLGTALTGILQALGRVPEDLQTSRWQECEIRQAEAGTWQPREFWAAIDAAVNAGGTLLRLHDICYAGPVPASPDPGPFWFPEPPPPGPPPHVARLAAEIAARITAGHWPPGTRLLPNALAADHAKAPATISLALRELAAAGIVTPAATGVNLFMYLIPGTPAAAICGRADGEGIAKGRKR